MNASVNSPTVTVQGTDGTKETLWNIGTPACEKDGCLHINNNGQTIIIPLSQIEWWVRQPEA